jgi:3-oxoacyl-[acyl-carrier-protein] synthase II
MTVTQPPRRVVVTGLGVIAPNGCDLGTFWQSVRDGVSAAGPISRFDVSKVPHKIAAEVRGFEPARYLGAKQARRFERCLQYELAAAGLAAKDAALDFNRLDADRLGIVDASTVNGIESTLKAHLAFLEHGYKGMSPFTFINAYSGSGSGEVALHLGIKGHAITYCSGSASGNDAIGYAANMIRNDEADLMLAGGCEAPLIEAFWHGFCVNKVMTRRNEEPARAMRPFDRSRDGFVMGEGAAFLVLEELAHALDRRAHIRAEVLGQGRSCEAYHSVLPHPDGAGIYRAMEKALRQARLHPSEVDYINAHGTATESNDLAETRAIKRLFGPAATRVAVSATKPVTGHLLGAAGVLEAVICVLALEQAVIPPTINLDEPAEGCDLDYVPLRPRPYPVRVAMNLNSGFGGKNSCLVLGRFHTPE